MAQLLFILALFASLFWVIPIQFLPSRSPLSAKDSWKRSMAL
ncbi:MAG: hypothetical protein M5U05_13045 [Anaerolineales bacterium]|nr:hypothetical protein [Anaerolineales bacterium]